MTLKSLLSSTKKLFLSLSKVKVVELLVLLQKEYAKLEVENATLKAELQKQKIQEVNKIANKPSSKQAEWEKVTPITKGKKNNSSKKKVAREGAGNQTKKRQEDKTETASVNSCDGCGKDLKKTPALASTNEHTIEDISEPSETTEIIRVIKEKKYCNDCQQVTVAKSERALPGTDTGLNATVLICYLWVSLCLPFTKIQDYLTSFFGLERSTSGLSKHVIMVSGIMKEVHDEILQDVQTGITLFADETGWRVKGKNWWLWVFGTDTSAFFTVDKSRGSDVVRRVLGEIFLGVLVVDGWSAYLSLICEKQTCMAHIFRKIKKLRDAFPQLYSIGKFYLKLRRIILDGEKLQKQRKELGEKVYQRRLLLLHKRLEALVQWRNPNEILQEIIKKVIRQQPRILTFVEHDGVPSNNNYAERLIRIGVLKRKVSGGSMSAEGAEAYAVLLSIYVTCKLRNIPFRKYLKESLICYIRTGKPMLLKEYEKLIFDSILHAKAA